MPRDQIFISYSHEDKEWLERLQTSLKPYLREGLISSWSDQQISPGSEWFEAIKSALTKTNVAVLLVTPDFIASDFIHEHELGPLLKEAEQGGTKILWVPVYHSAYKKTALKNYQAVLDPDKPLGGMTKAKRDHAWVKICEEIEKAVNKQRESRPFVGGLTIAQSSIEVEPSEIGPIAQDEALRLERVQHDTTRRPSRRYEVFNTAETWKHLIKVGRWQFEQTTGSFMSGGVDRYLLSDSEYGAWPFTIDARIEFLELRPETADQAVNAGIVLGWTDLYEKPRYLHLMFTGSRLLLEQTGQSGRNEYHYRHIDEGVPFLLRTFKAYEISLQADENAIDISIDGREVYSARPPTDSLKGKVGLRPWRSVLKCDRFEVKRTSDS